MQQDKNKFGFYKVGDLNFYSKVEAIEMQTRTGIHPHWDFNEDVFSSYDWTKEPTESLSELYRRRAQQLREKYDYLILWYSSGADSQNILQSFLDNDILLDEVASFVNEQTDKDDYFLNSEIYNISQYTIKKYQESYPDLKHRIVDNSQPVVDFFSNPINMLEWKYYMNVSFNPNATVRSNLFKTVKDWSNLVNSGKKVCFIWGIDKPRLDIVDGKYCTVFLDFIDFAVSPLWQMTAGPGEFCELFYWTPDMPEIPIKQSHIVKNYMKTANENSPFINSQRSGIAYTIVNGKKLWLSTVGVNSLVYPNYKFDILNQYKPESMIFTQRDNWFWKFSESEIAYKNWKESLSAVWKTIPDYWKNDSNDLYRGFKCSVSKPYFLE